MYQGINRIKHTDFSISRLILNEYVDWIGFLIFVFTDHRLGHTDNIRHLGG